MADGDECDMCGVKGDGRVKCPTCDILVCNDCLPEHDCNSNCAVPGFEDDGDA